MVPQFSGLAAQESISAEAVRTSAHTALNSAVAISQLAADILALEWDPVQLAPFVGYAMYVAASIHISMVFAHNPRLSHNARNGLTHSLRLLKLLKPYWKNLNRLVRRTTSTIKFHRCC